MKKYIIYELYDEDFNAGFKATEDIKEILIHMGMELVPISIKRKKGIKKYYSYLKSIINDYIFFQKKIEYGGIIFLQIPVRFPRYIFIMYLLILKKVFRGTLIGIIHDVEQLRYENGKRYVKAEKNIYKLLNKIIVHNNSMKNFFIQSGIEDNKLYELGIFDYLVEEKLFVKEKNGEKVIVIAGNLSPEKAKYLYEIKNELESIEIRLYGPNYVSNTNNNCTYLGVVDSGKLPNVLYEMNDFAFGLIWDGDSLNECGGYMGRYMKYNNPHKLSLYLAAGMPVIVWKQAAICRFVEENGVGFSIKAIDEIPGILEKMDASDIDLMQKNAIKIGNKLRRGEYIRSVTNLILELYS